MIRINNKHQCENKIRRISVFMFVADHTGGCEMSLIPSGG